MPRTALHKARAFLLERSSVMENMRGDRLKGDPSEQSQVDDDPVTGYGGDKVGPGDEDPARSGGQDESRGMGGDRPTPSDY
jgi:hypothetical protein